MLAYKEHELGENLFRPTCVPATMNPMCPQYQTSQPTCYLSYHSLNCWVYLCHFQVLNTLLPVPFPLRCASPLKESNFMRQKKAACTCNLIVGNQASCRLWKQAGIWRSLNASWLQRQSWCWCVSINSMSLLVGSNAMIYDCRSHRNVHRYVSWHGHF